MSVLDSMSDIMRVEMSLRQSNRSVAPLGLIELVNRITFGFTNTEYQLARNLGYQGYLERHLNHLSIDDSALNARLAGPEFPTLTMTPDVLLAQASGDVQNQLTRARILRAIYSNRQLFERMVDFWSDHFNIYLFEGIAVTQKTYDDASVIRPHALGNFPMMLSASAHSPSMLNYLNNDTNTASAPNENYAREIMELHTLGVDGGYTQADVQSVARCFTGWTYYGTTTNPANLRYTFRFNSGNHDNGQKIVLGNIVPAGGGQQDGETVLQILANHPSTARFIAKKMLKHFWGEDPPQELILSIAKVYTKTQGDIKSMMRAILDPTSGYFPQPRFKRPLHLMVSAMRALDGTITTNSVGSLQSPLSQCGHTPFGWSPPDGYPDTLLAWSGLLLPRWSYGAALMNDQYSGVRVDVNALVAGIPAPLSAAKIVTRLNDRLFGRKMPASEREALTAYLLPDPPTTARIREATGLAVGSPAFQWY